MTIQNEYIKPKHIFFLDLGSGFTKFGHHQIDAPVKLIPTAFGIPRLSSTKDLQAEPNIFGEKLDKFTGPLERIDLFPNSLPKNNFNILKFIEHLFEVQDIPTEGSGLILGVSPEWPQDFLFQMQAFLFPKYNFVSILPMRTEMLSLIGHKLRTGVILNIGHYCSRIVQFYEGKLVNTMGIKTSIAGKTIREYLIKLYNKRHPYLSATMFSPVLTELIHNLCEFSLNINNTLSSNKISLNKEIQISQLHNVLNFDIERFLGPEILFHPKLINKKDLSIDELVVQSLKECNPTYRQDIFSNIVLSGGGCAFPNFSQRLTQMFEKIPLLAQTTLKMHPRPELSSWKGMQLIANSSFYEKHAKTQNQFFAKL